MDRAEIDRFVDQLVENSFQARHEEASHRNRQHELRRQRMAIIATAERAGLRGVELEMLEQARQQVEELYGRVVATDSGVV